MNHLNFFSVCFCYAQENNDAYQPDGFSKKSFEQNVSDILDQAEPSKNHPRNNVKLDVNKLIAIGQYGDIIGGKLNATPCHVHVVSGLCYQF